MRRRGKENRRRATLTRNGIIASDLLISDATPPAHAREIEREPSSVASVTSQRPGNAESAAPREQQESTERDNQGQAEEQVARALVMAQRMADQTVEEAKIKAKAMVSEAEARAKTLTEQAQLRAREVTEAAQMRAREVTESAQLRAREVTETAQARARELTEG